MPKPVAIWNTARDVWETPQTEGLFCEHLDVCSEIFPTSGMTLNGVAYALPTWEPATHDSASLSLELFGTPTARMWKGSGPVGSTSHTWLLEHGNVEAQVLLLPTPRCSDGMKANLRSSPKDTTRLEDALGELFLGEDTSLESEAGKRLWEDQPLPL